MLLKVRENEECDSSPFWEAYFSSESDVMTAKRCHLGSAWALSVEIGDGSAFLSDLEQWTHA